MPSEHPRPGQQSRALIIMLERGEGGVVPVVLEARGILHSEAGRGHGAAGRALRLATAVHHSYSTLDIITSSSWPPAIFTSWNILYVVHRPVDASVVRAGVRQGEGGAARLSCPLLTYLDS